MEQTTPPGIAACEPEEARELACMLREAAGGNVAAFEAFYVATVRRVLPGVRRLCGESHCEDAMADAYFQAWTTLATFDAERGNALAWIRMIAGSRARDRMRAERVRHGGAEGAIEANEDEAAAPGHGPEELLQDAQARALLCAAMALLPSNERMLIGLAYYRDCSHSEISEATGLPVGKIKNLMRASHLRLHTILSPVRHHISLP